MKIKITKQVGSSTIEFEVEEQKDIEALSSAGFVASTPTKCSECKSEDVTLESNKKDGYTFVKVRCHKCTATANVGSYKDGGHFWKKFELYTPNGGKTHTSEVKDEISDADLDSLFESDK